MAQDFNQVALIGRLTRDPQRVTFGNGGTQVEFSIANNQGSYTDPQTGERVERDANFFDCVCRNGVADTVEKYLAKGRRVLVSGVVRQERWTDKATDQKRSRVRIVALSVQFLDAPEQSKPENSTPTATPAPAAKPAADDDIPF